MLFFFLLVDLQKAAQSQKRGAGSKAQTTGLQKCIHLRLGIKGGGGGGGQIHTTAGGGPGFRERLKVRLQDGAAEHMSFRLR